MIVGSTSGGGAERVASTLANAWAARGDQVHLVPTLLGDLGDGYPLHTDVTLTRLDVDVSLSGIRKHQRKIQALRRVIEATSPTIVVSFMTSVNVLAILAMRGLRIPLVVSERVDPAAFVELEWRFRAARALCYQFADALVTQTSIAAQRYKRLILRAPRTVVIANPLPSSLHASSLRAAPGATDRSQLLAMGRLTPQKRFDLLIRAFAKAFAARPHWTLTIFGEGPLKSELQSLIDSLELQQRIRLAGGTSEPWAELAKAQLFALSSAYEGFPNAMLEAMAVGLPCVAFDCPSGPRDLALEGQAALLVPPGDSDELANVLGLLADDPGRRAQLGRIAAESVRERFSEATVLSLWDRLFDELTPCRN